MKAVVVICAVVAICAVLGGADARQQNTRLRQVLASKEKALASVELQQYMTLRAEMLAPVLEMVTKGQATPTEIETIMKAVAIRNARFEAAIGISVQSNEKALTWVLTETIRRVICVAKAIRGAEKPAPKFDDIVGDVFALPGSQYDSKPSSFIKLDSDRSGPFFTDSFPANVKDLYDVVEKDGNIRELLHAIARLGLVGEGKTPEEIKGSLPKSWRGLLLSIDPKAPNKALAKCGFNSKHLIAALDNVAKNPADAAKKGVLAPLPGSEVIGARKPGFKVNPHANWKENPAKKTLLSGKLYQQLGMQPISAREKAFMSKNIFNGEPVTDDTIMPWSPGAYMTRFDAHEANKEWLGKMDGQGLLKDAGPSGTTDEILQAGDYVSITTDTFGACLLRDAASGGMHVQLHHSWGEVAQGATAIDRATPAFSFEDPYVALAQCPIKARALKAIVDPWTSAFKGAKRAHAAAPPSSIDHFAAAFQVYKALTNSPQSPLSKALAMTDFGAGPEKNHPFSPTVEPKDADALIQKYICATTAKGPGVLIKNFMHRVICNAKGGNAGPSKTGPKTGPSKTGPKTGPKSGPKTGPPPKRAPPAKRAPPPKRAPPMKGNVKARSTPPSRGTR